MNESGRHREDVFPRPFHGGDIAWAEGEFGAPPAPWLDLSTGINPWPYPVGTPAGDGWAGDGWAGDGRAGDVWARLPDSGLEARLHAAAANRYGAPGAGCVAAAPGSQMAIQLVPRLRAPGRVAVIGPTYGEHAPCWRAAGHMVVETDDAALEGEWDVVVLTNPNNPDGRLIAPERIVKGAGRMGARGGWVVVDEAFADVAPEYSVAAHVDMPGLMVLRSFGKFFGLAGLRLGFALAPPALAAEIRAALGPWPFSRPAGTVAIEALGDSAWIEATRVRLADAATRLDRVLISSGFTVLGGTALFRLAEHADAQHIFRHLAGEGILARNFSDRPGRLRFGLPGADGAMERLRAALAPWRRGAAP